MVGYRELGRDVRRGFHAVGNELETEGKTAGIEAEAVREAVAVGMANGVSLEGIAWTLVNDRFMSFARAAKLVRLAYVGS